MPLKSEEQGDIPIIEVFGGAFAIFMILFLILNLFSASSRQERMEDSVDEGEYKISWENQGAGFVVLVFPGKIRLIETNESISKDKICQVGSPFISYAFDKYSQQDRQIIFALLEGSVATMAEARKCLIKIMPQRSLTIGWLIANHELLKSVSLNDIPPYIEQVISQ